MSFFGFKRFKCYLPYAFVTDLPTEISPSQGAVLLTLTRGSGKRIIEAGIHRDLFDEPQACETLNLKTKLLLRQLLGGEPSSRPMQISVRC